MSTDSAVKGFTVFNDFVTSLLSGLITFMMCQFIFNDYPRNFSSVHCHNSCIYGSLKPPVQRSIGLMRAKFNIGLMNLTYNLKRVETLIRLKMFEFSRISPPVVR
jgi:hypothetical protein